MITASQLQTILPLKPERASFLSDLINEGCIKYGITDKKVLAAFLANVIHESGGFTLKDESLNYSAKRLMQVWPSRFPDMAIATQYANNSRKLATLVYGGRMGNTQPDDGYNFKGGGFIQLTGRDMFTKYGKYIGYNPEETAAKVRTEDYYALDSALWFYCIERKLTGVTDFRAIVKAINGGFTGWDERKKYYDKAIFALV